MPNTLANWLQYLEALHPVGIDLGLDRVAEVAKRMGLSAAPIAKKVVIVAGTNGKGSTIAIMDAVARAHGLSVGTYSSPHLLRYNERVRIAGQEIDDASLIEGFERVEQARLQSPDVSLTYFEAGTLCALWCLAQAELDLALLEVGLGGRLDAVNIIDADVAIVTTIAQDHESFLGSDIGQIGYEKAGVFRPLRPAVLGSQALPPTVADAAIALAAPVFGLGGAFSHSAVGEPGERWCWHGLTADGDTQSLDSLPDPRLPIDNAATALQALTLCGVSLRHQACQTALGSVQLPGRMQWLGQWCLDVGHNPHAAAYVAEHLPRPPEGGQQWALVGMLDDKDADGVIDALLPHIDVWLCVTLAGERGRGADDLAERITRAGGQVMACANSPEEGAEWLAPHLTPADRVLATGSFFTVAALLDKPLPQAEKA